MARVLWLADRLRAAGLTVVEHSGWQTREVAGAWEPRFAVVHATAAPTTQSDETQIRIVRDGRRNADGSFLEGPIANACVDHDGVWHVLGAGRCNTVKTGWAGPFAGLGNRYAFGVEACNDNRLEPWPAVQYEAYARGYAAILDGFGWTTANLIGHKEHQPGDKTDPTFNMDQFRARVAAYMRGDDDMPLTDADVAKIWAAKDSAGDAAAAALHVAHARADSAYAMTKVLAAKLDAIGRAVEADDDVDELALAAALAAPLAERIIAALPGSTAGLTQEQVEQAVRNAFAGGLAPEAG